MVNNLIVCGGTFDHFHKGHREFLKYAFSLGEKIIVGITSDIYVLSSKSKIKNPKLIEAFGKRKQSVLDFIFSEKASDKVNLLEINDLFGPTLSKDLLIDAVVVSKNTKLGAEIINSKRKELGLSQLKILIFPGIKSENGELISSHRIRNGEINRLGKPYINEQWYKTNLSLPDDLRKELEKPFGLLNDDVLKDKNQSELIISVGDVTTEKLNKLGFSHQLSVVDFKVARENIFSSFSDLGFSGNEKIVLAKNHSGRISHDSFNMISEIIKFGFDQRTILKIIGEEDLIVLPIILATPLGTIIYYGQPNKGLVRVLVSEESKERAYNLISRFEPI